MATKYSQPQNENRVENNIHLFTGSIMDPFKTGPTGLFATALVSLGKSGKVSLGMVPKPAAIANQPVPFDTKSQVTVASFSTVTGWTETACINKIAKIKMTGSIIDPGGK